MSEEFYSTTNTSICRMFNTFQFWKQFLRKIKIDEVIGLKIHCYPTYLLCLLIQTHVRQVTHVDVLYTHIRYTCVYTTKGMCIDHDLKYDADSTSCML